MNQFAFLQPSPIRPTFRNLSPIRKSPLHNNYAECQKNPNLSPLRRNRQIQNPPCRSPSKTPVRQGKKKSEFFRSRKPSYEMMESTIKKKCGLFQEMLKKKSTQESNGKRMMIQTTTAPQEGFQTTFSQLSDRKKWDSALNEEKSQQRNTTEIESVQCSRTNQQTIKVLSAKCNQQENKQMKPLPSNLQDIFISSFGTPKCSELTVVKNDKENIKDLGMSAEEESYGDVDLLLRKITEGPEMDKHVEAEDLVKVSIEEDSGYNFNMNPFLC